MEEKIANDLIPSLFGTTLPPVSRDVTKLSARCAGLGLFDPTHTAQTNPDASKDISHVIVESLLDPTKEFQIEGHAQRVKSARKNCRDARDADHQMRLDAYKTSLPSTAEGRHSRHILDNACQTGRLLSIPPNAAFNTDLSATEFRDRLHFRYGLDPPNLPLTCDGCGEKSSISHAMTCKKGGLVILRHNEIKDSLGDLCSEALQPSAVRDEPLINPARVIPPAQITTAANTATNPEPVPANVPANVPEEPVTFVNSTSHNRGDLLIRGFFNRGTDVIVDVRIVDLNCKTHRNKTAASVLKSAEQEKKHKYKRDCEQQRRTFVPFVMSTCGLIGGEAKNFLQRLGKIYAEKSGDPYSRARLYHNTVLDIALVRACHLCLRGSRINHTSTSFSRNRPESQLEHSGQFLLLT